MGIFAFKAAAFFYQMPDRRTDAYFNDLCVLQCFTGKEQICRQHRLIVLHRFIDRQGCRRIDNDRIFFRRTGMGIPGGISLRNGKVRKVAVGNSGSDGIEKRAVFFFHPCFNNDFCCAHCTGNNTGSLCNFTDKPAG